MPTILLRQEKSASWPLLIPSNKKSSGPQSTSSLWKPNWERYFGSHPGEVVPERHAGFGYGQSHIPSARRRSPLNCRFVGDCLQNLRSSLDYLVWELVLSANNHPRKNNMFPICSTADAFKDAVTNLTGCSEFLSHAVTLIQNLQPYHLGQDWKKAIIAVLTNSRISTNTA